ncbi:MAG: PAS domain S-box protein, partial [Anaerolineae bacterium]
HKDGTSRWLEATAQNLLDNPDVQAIVITHHDITERKQADEALQKWAHIFEHTEVGITVGSADGKSFELLNPAFARMHGYTVQELIGQSPLIVFAPEVRAELPVNIQLAHEKGHHVWESIHIRQDGTRFPAQMDATTVRDAQGKVLYRVVNVQDISERKQAEEAQRKSEAQFRAVVENSHDGILFCKANGVAQYRSPSERKINGYSNEERIGRSGFEIIHPDDVDATRTQWTQVLQHPGTPYSAKYRVRHKDGTSRWLEATAQNLLDNPDVQAIVITHHDITERKQAEEALSKSEARFRAIVENSRDGIIFSDASGVIQYRSPAEQVINGYSNEERIGHSGFEIVHPDDVDAIHNRWPQILQHPGTPYPAEYRIRHKDGTWRWLEATTQNLLNNPDVQAILINNHDITERKQAEEARRKSEAQFRAVVENSHDGILMVDRDRRVLYVSLSYTRLSGYMPQDLIGKYGADYIHPDDQPLTASKIREVLQTPGASVSVEYRILHKGGGWRWVDTTATNLLDDPDVQAVVLHSRDISKRKRAEETNRQHTQRLQALLDLVQTASDKPAQEVISAGLEEAVQLTGSAIGYFHFFNADDQTVQLYTWSRDTLLQCQAVEETHYPLESAGVWADCIRTRLPVVNNDYASLETKRGLPEGHVPLVRHLGAPVIDQGQVQVIVGVGNKPTDYDDNDVRILSLVAENIWKIFQRQRMQEALTQENEQLALTLDSIGDGMITTDAAGRILLFNPMAEQLTGWRRAEAGGQPLHTVLHLVNLKTGEAAPNPVQVALQSGRRVGLAAHTVLVARDGTRRVISSSVAPIRGPANQITGAVLIFRDITQLHQTEEALKESQAYARSLIESSLDMIIAVDTERKIVEFNRAAEHTFGYSRAEILGQSVDLLYADSELGDEVHAQTLASAERVQEVRNKRKDGQVFPTLVSASRLRNAQGEVVGVMGISRDITRQKQVEEQTVRSERLAALGRMAAALAHEINNPLQALQSTLDLVLDFELDEAERTSNLEIIRQEIERLSQVTARILNFARPVATRHRRVDVSAIVQDTLNLAYKQLQHAHIQVTTDLKPMPQILAAPEQLAQVFLNLVLNAVQAMPERGHLHAAASAEGEGIMITFTNDGPPIPPQDLPHLFDAFFTTKAEGSGIGLFISQLIVQQHGGTIQAENLPEGVRFTVYLPFADRS